MNIDYRREIIFLLLLSHTLVIRSQVLLNWHHHIISGHYQCRLFDGDSSFLQDSNERFSLLETPTIRIVPLNNKMVCEVGQELPLQCSVQEPYHVKFKDFPNTGKTETERHPNYIWHFAVYSQIIARTVKSVSSSEFVFSCN